MQFFTNVRQWPRRRWLTALVGAIATALVLGLPTDVIANPVFGRQGTPVTWWSYLALAISSILSGLLLATYVNPSGARIGRDERSTADLSESVDAPSRAGSIGALFTFFAIGCPICNKLVVIALGAAGATRWFAPVQPWLAVGSIVLLAWAVRRRVESEAVCSVR